ncbi:MULTISPECIES: ribonuclease R [Marinobacter]|jgi:ribonuclease R|uniref:ribonuclease R n=1 Tax=Marinobacter TaxID=2742 RepID=UPI000256EB68|nr:MULTISPECIES: ribonuclease R [Marinobacter]MEC8898554.1 ribonuclease R [Pseudomonadota bacterium]MBN8240323.1 ribonuclease R [Marinobacter nauticus]MCC4272162.1 ribonuclease R [Marinobacter nauticus]MCS5561858.1 ribonuclease R [Marinobacter nauticus]MEC9386227.1 ribonuclease R [Pseudomonadota bacterium]
MVSRKNKQSDPHAQREAQKYDNPIQSREYILQHLKERGAPATHETLCQELGQTSAEGIEALRRRLIAMCRDGQLICNRRDAFLPIEEADLVTGRVVGHRDGFGFLIPDDGGSDLFLTARQMRQVFHGDRVAARVDQVDDRGRREGKIVEVLEHRTSQIVGRFFKESGIAFVVPENARINHEILVPDEQAGKAVHGQYVVVEIIRQPTIRTQPTGQVIEILGEHMAPGMEIDVAIRSYEIPHSWPPAVGEQAASIPAEVAEKDKANRVDIRNMRLVTIDDESARDFDDAIYCEPRPRGGYRLVVAIADVSHYVRPGSPLDEEAIQRGNSVYFPDHVVPMLPEKLSNGLCSLNPDVDRLCMVADMTISAAGNISGYTFYQAVMRSHARLTYNKVSAMLEHPDTEQGYKLSAHYADLLPHLHNLYDLYKLLRKARTERGAIDFETTETKIVFDAQRKIEEIVPVHRNDAHKIVEECMLCANVATARFLKKHKIPALYRVHDGPSEERLSNLRLFLGELGLQLGGGDKPSSADYQALLGQVADRPDANVIQMVMLRSLSQAVYSPEEAGHFGLGFASYTHFTSPIRRYPDLIVHRAIKSRIHNPEATKDLVSPKVHDPELAEYPYDYARMEQLGEHCSMTERRADDATRDVMAWLKCEFLRDHVGEEYDGIIGAVVPFGFFVELSDIYIEGLVHVSTLSGDYFHHDAVKHRLIGERTAVSFRLGDEVRVRVVRVDLEDRKIDLELVSTPRRRKADRDALEVSKREPRGKGKGGRSGKGQKSGKPASAKEKLAAEAAREARSKSAKGKPSGSGRKRKSRK